MYFHVYKYFYSDVVEILLTRSLNSLHISFFSTCVISISIFVEPLPPVNIYGRCPVDCDTFKRCLFTNVMVLHTLRGVFPSTVKLISG